MKPFSHNGRQTLEGLKVLDLSHIVAGGMATGLLANLGAEVIKVERPGAGDGLRTLGPVKDNKHLWWKTNARNKKSITLNLKTEEGKSLCKQLVEQSDVVVENFRPGTLEKLGLGWDVLSSINEKLVMLRISGYGQTGPYSSRAGFGKAGEAMSGIVQLTGFPDGPPLHVGFSMADASTGLMGAFSVMTTLYHRDHVSGKGQFIDLALYETLNRLLDWQVIAYDQLGFVPQRAGNRFPINISGIGNIYQSKDSKWITVPAGSQRAVERVLTIIGGEELAMDPRFSTNRARDKNEDLMDTLVRDWIAQHDAVEVLRVFEENSAVASMIYDVKDMFEDLHFAHRENIIEVEDEELGKVKMTGIVPKLSSTPGRVTRTGPKLGQDNWEVFIDTLGISESAFQEFSKNGVI